MTDTKTEINQTLHRLLNRGCWHKRIDAPSRILCTKCGEAFLTEDLPNYAEDIRAAFEAQAEVVERVDSRLYIAHLVAVVGGKFLSEVLDDNSGYITKDHCFLTATATAQQRTAAMVAALTAQEN